MIKLLDRFVYLYALFYTLILYYFFTSFPIRERLFNMKSSYDLNKYTVSNLSIHKEKKILVDFQYKKKIQISILDNISEKSILIDKEYRILGYKQVDYRQQLHTKFSFYLNKKLFHSSLFGSIKLIKI
jgi:hypothetical protein